MTSSKQLSWSQTRRLQFIDFRLAWDGSLNRADLQEHFGISTPQASLDIAAYTKLSPENLDYDRSSRTYRATDKFKPVFDASGPRQYLAQLWGLTVGVLSEHETFLGLTPPVANVPLPNRAVAPAVLKLVVQGIEKGQTLDISYQSITRDEPLRRQVTPHALARDGLRWHVRAYCHMRQGYRDFVIGRILEVHGIFATPPNLPIDEPWERILRVVIKPAPGLPKAVQRGIEVDFAMTNGTASLQCREAMLFYLFKALGLNEKGEPLPGIKQIVLGNRNELRAYLPQLGQP